MEKVAKSDNFITKSNTSLKSTKATCIIIISILLFNAGIYLITDYFPFSEKIQARKDATGFCSPYASEFIYFYYYTGYFPLATIDSNLIYSRQGALEQIKENGKSLIMEYKHWSRLGENARIWAFLPNAILKCSPENPSIKLFNALFFTLSLILLYLGFKKVNNPLFGLFLVILVNFTPFFIYEVYSRENIFGLMASGFFIVIGLNIHALFSKTGKFLKYCVVCIISGFLIGFFSEIRNETSILIISLLLVYILSNKIKILPKFGISFLIILSFLGSKNLIRYYFDNNFKDTSELVDKFNGHVYNGGRINGHRLWHPVFCGLGDFDKKYGYEWNDRVAYNYAIPVLKEKHGLNILYSGELYINEYYDSAKLYYKKFDEISVYEEVVKEKVLTDIKSDPLWYATIILKRIARNMTQTIPVPYIGWILLPLIFFLIKRKNWDMLKLIIISLPLSITSILIFSGKGATYNSLYLYFVIVICFFELYKNKSPLKS
ncbi:MAG: hypothetical protein ABIJ97_06620 [Bacteroidota bacterium]